MKSESALLDYFGRIEIIHLKARTDRYRLLVKELNSLGVDVNDTRVRIPDAFMAENPNGFSSKQVYGNFMSHLDILRRARDEGCTSVLVLEDDAIFRSALSQNEMQLEVISQLQKENWSMLFLGHPLSAKLKLKPRGLIVSNEYFKWAHCYAVHSRALRPLISYLEQCIERPAGHPDGGRMYIDGAFSMFRARHPDLVTLLYNPSLSVQRGSSSGIAMGKWYDQIFVLRPLLSLARKIRDSIWKYSGFFGTK